MTDSQGDSVVNDNGVNTTKLSAVASHVATNVQPDLVLFTGDLVYGTSTQAGLESQLTTWRDTMAPIYNAGIPVYAVRGSHDLGPNDWTAWGRTAWNNVFTGQYAMPGNGPSGEEGVTYSFTYNNAIFLGMDEYKTSANSDSLALTWLDSQLAGNTQPHVFAFSHTQLRRVEHSVSLDNYPAIRDPFVQKLRDAGSRAYFCGHMHLAQLTKLNDNVKDPTNSSPDDDFYQVIVPPADQKFYSWDGLYNDGNAIPGMTPYNLLKVQSITGYTVVEVNGFDVTITFMKQGSGGGFESIGSFSYTAVPEPVTAGLLAFGGLALLRRRRIRKG